MGDFLQRRVGLLIGLGITAVLIAVLAITGEKQSIVIGTITGAAYGLVALGLVLIYKSSGVFNFAQGEFGGVALCTLYLLHSNDVLRLRRARRPWRRWCWASSPSGRGPPAVRRAPRDPPRRHRRGGAACGRHPAVVLRVPGRPIARAFTTIDRLTILGVQISDQRCG